MSQKTVPFSQKGIRKLPDDRPVVYKIFSAGGTNIYTGAAKRGRVQERIAEHLPGAKDPVPGAKVRVEQASSIAEALAREQRVIGRSQPKYNEQGK
jgi:excinuclease UvrABC nuclease subunit